MGKIEDTLSKLQNLYIHEFKESETELIGICNNIIDNVYDALTSNKQSFTYQIGYYAVDYSDLRRFTYPLKELGYSVKITTDEIRTTFYDTEKFYILKVTL